MQPVERLRWPSQSEERRAFDRDGTPCLLLVAADADAPSNLGKFEDWIRLPASEADITTRITQLAERAASRQRSLPMFDETGLLRVGEKWVAIPPVEASLVSALLENFGSVIARNDLIQAAWPDSHMARNALDVRILRLRRRIEPLGLAVRTVRSRGYLIEYAEN